VGIPTYPTPLPFNNGLSDAPIFQWPWGGVVPRCGEFVSRPPRFCLGPEDVGPITFQSPLSSRQFLWGTQFDVHWPPVWLAFSRAGSPGTIHDSTSHFCPAWWDGRGTTVPSRRRHFAVNCRLPKFAVPVLGQRVLEVTPSNTAWLESPGNYVTHRARKPWCVADEYPAVIDNCEYDI